MAGWPDDVATVINGGQLTLYLASGKRKHDRYFWVSAERRDISWDKQKSAKPNKTAPLRGVVACPAVKSAREWFDEIDADRSGALDSSELATLYKRARGEKLSKKRLAEAMAVMDRDGSGRVELQEFEAWWSENGGDLEKHRGRAITILAGELQLLAVASDAETKRRWVSGLEAVLSGKRLASWRGARDLYAQRSVDSLDALRAAPTPTLGVAHLPRRASAPPATAAATAPTATAPAPRPAAPLPRRPAAVDGGRPPPLPLVLSSDSNYSATDFATPEEKSAQRGFLFIHLHKAT